MTRTDNIEGSLPFVAVVCAAPLLYEALKGALDSIADVRVFPAGRGDIHGLLGYLRPDAVVVDDKEEAEAAVAFAREAGVPLVHVSYDDRGLEVLASTGWVKPSNGGASPAAIRNVLVGGLFGRAGPA